MSLFGKEKKHKKNNRRGVSGRKGYFPDIDDYDDEYEDGEYEDGGYYEDESEEYEEEEKERSNTSPGHRHSVHIERGSRSQIQ